jgi:NarL family two-component system response regulator LiaR
MIARDNHSQVASKESKLLQQPFGLITPSPLSSRELEVLKLLVEGHTNSAIATTLHLSLSTVKTYVRSIMNKLGGNSRLQIAVMAVRYGIV